MAVFKGPLKSSVNSGQLSKDLAGKVGIKQYYSGARRMIGLEPIPQSGFDLLPGSARVGTVASASCRKGVLKVNAALSYVLIFTVGSVDIWRNDRVKVATKSLPSITAEMLPDLGFYGEANTFGIFHPSLPLGMRLLRDATNDANWTVGNWPFSDIPEVDLGGTYATTPDIWNIYFRWVDSTADIVLSCSVDGATAASASLDAGPSSATGAQWVAFAAEVEDRISALPGFSSGVTVTHISSAVHYGVFQVIFGGALAGSEYQFDARIVNTSDASALLSHPQIGETQGEPLISVSRGGFAGMELYQDRSTYFAPAGRPAAFAMSKIGEYFDLNIKVEADNGARLEALRTQTSETIRFMLDNTYLVIFTDQAEWFASNRTVSRNEPLNLVRASEIGVKKNCRPVIMEGDVYFMSKDGGILYSISYDAVSTTYEPAPQNDLNKDLVSNIKRQAVQRKIGSSTSNRQWLLREDGRLICAVVNKTQEIMAASEWLPAGGGLVKEIVVDGQEQVWITVDRAGQISEEILEEASLNLLHCSLTVMTDLAGQASGLSVLNGKEVWAQIGGNVLGPFTVAGGVINTGVASATAKIGLWSAPFYESMPYVQVLPDDTVVRRPGSVKAAKLFLIDTDSVAVGANGRAPKNVPLNRVSDDLTLPPLSFNGHVSVLGLIGATMDPTLVITQTRPGRLRVRDYIPGVKL